MLQGMHVTAYSPLGTPGSGSITHRAKNVPELLQDPLVQSIAHKHNKHPAQVPSLPLELVHVHVFSLELVYVHVFPPELKSHAFWPDHLVIDLLKLCSCFKSIGNDCM